MSNLTSKSFEEPLRVTPVEEPPIGLVALWTLLWGNKRPIVLWTIGLVVLTSILVLRTPDTFSSETQILLTRGNLDIIEFDGGDRSTVTSGAVTNALTIINSRDVYVQVAERLNLMDDPLINTNLLPSGERPSREGLMDRLMFWQEAPAEDDVEMAVFDAMSRQLALDWLEDVTTVSILPESNVIVVRASTYEPAQSAAVANAFADMFLEYQLNASQQESAGAAEALAVRVAELGLQLEENQGNLQSFMSNADNMSVEASANLFNEVAQLRSRLNLVQVDAQLAEEAIDILSSGAGAAALRGIVDDNATLRGIESDTFGARLTSAQLAQQLPRLRNAAQVELDRNTRLAQAFEENLMLLEQEVKDSNASAVALRQLEVELETTSQVYQASLARLKELILQSGLRDAGGQILARAEEPFFQDRQGRRRAVAIAGFLGLFIGIAYVLIREASNDRVRRTADLADASGAHKIFSLPQLPNRFSQKALRSKTGIFGDQSRFFSGIQTIRQYLLQIMPNGQEHVTIGVFSAIDTDSKLHTAVALAHSFTMLNKSVLLVDTDMRTNEMPLALSLTDVTSGLQDVVVNDVPASDAITAMPELGFDVLTGGTNLMNPADLIESQKFWAVFADLQKMYDVIILNTAPILVVPDARTVANHVDRHILVTEFDKTPKGAVREAADIFHDLGAGNLIVTLSNSPLDVKRDYGAGRRAVAQT